MDQLVSILPLVLIAVVFWLFMVRPAARRQKALAALQSALQPGDRVILSSGILGEVDSLGTEDLVKVRIADGVVIEVVRNAIVSSSRADDALPGTTTSTDTDTEPTESTESAEVTEPAETPRSTGPDGIDGTPGSDRPQGPEGSAPIAR